MSEVVTRICLDCGAPNAPEASFCGRCGHALLENLEDARTEISSSQDAWLITAPDNPGTPDSSNENLEEVQTAQAQVSPEMQKRCAWCSGLSSWTAVTCEVCGARFPVPEQDAAFQRAADERMRQEEESLDFWRLRRRRGWRRFLI